MLREMDERSLEENNLVFHRVKEASGGEARRRTTEDKDSIQLLLHEMDLDIVVEESTKFARRLGPRSDHSGVEDRNDPKPLLVGFTHRHHTELILENSWKLGESENPAVRSVSLVRYLRLRQRAGENPVAGGSMEGRGSGEEWRTSGRGGSLRPRAISRSPPSKEPQAKRVDTKNSPLSARKGNSIFPPGPGSKNIYEELLMEDDETEDDAVVVV